MAASTALEAALAQPEQADKKPPAVICDIDETLLDNGPYQAWLALSGAAFDRVTWHAWVNQRRAQALPGARAFVEHATRAGVTVFYVTNRHHEVEEATRDNLETQGLPPGDRQVDRVLTRGERSQWRSSKASRRAHVESTHRVLLYLGDQRSDFPDGDAGGAWGHRWFMLPNPSYGSFASRPGGAREALKRWAWQRSAP